MKANNFLCIALAAISGVCVTSCKKDMTNMGTVDSPILSLTEDTVTMHIGETHKLSLSYGISRVEWQSRYDTVATVDFRGVVTALQSGTTIVTATRSYDQDNLPNRTDSCLILVSE